MTNTTDTLDFNDVGSQRTFDVIPDATVCTLHMQIKPGGAGPDGWLTRSKDGASEHLNCEFVIIGGAFDKRKLWSRLTVAGANHAEAAEISRRTLGAMLESARNIRPDDKSPAAAEARRVKSWGEFDHLCFIARLGVEPPKNGYAAKNTIKKVITPDEQAWRKPELPAAGSGAPAGNPVTAPAQQPTPAPANAIARPAWARSEKEKA